MSLQKSRSFVNSHARGFVQLFLLLSFLVLECDFLHAQNTAPARLTGSENHSITLTEAAKLTKNFQTDPSNTVTTTTIRAEYFGRNALFGMLNQSGCVGLRIYYGKKDDGTPVLVLVGVDAAGKDMTDGLLSEYGFPCPPLCWDQSPLNR